MPAQKRALDGPALEGLKQGLIELATLVASGDRSHGTEYASLTLTNGREVRVNKIAVVRLEALSNNRTKVFTVDGKNVTVAEDIDEVTAATGTTPSSVVTPL